jgi:FtsZ-binding cell division protein ZapB
MKETKLKTPLGTLNLTFRDTTHAIVELPKDKPCEVNRVPLYFQTYYELKAGKWEPEMGYQSFQIPDRWGKEVSKATRQKVYDKVIECLTKFVEAQTLFMLGVKLDALKTHIDSAHRQQQENIDKMKELQDQNLNLASQVAGWQVEITTARETFKSKPNKA